MLKRNVMFLVAAGISTFLGSCGISQGRSGSSSATSSDQITLSEIIQGQVGKLYSGYDLLGRSCTVDFRNWQKDGSIHISSAKQYDEAVAMNDTAIENDCDVGKLIMRQNSILLTSALPHADDEWSQVSAIELGFTDGSLKSLNDVIINTSQGRSDRLACAKVQSRIRLHMADARCFNLVEVKPK